jgi:hypothetical protein
VEGEVPTTPNSPAKYDLNYEIWMLEETNKRHHDDEVLKNALIESFCVHARNLFEFFMEEAPQYTQNHEPFSHITKNRCKAILRKLNVHITHVKFQGRATNDADKINDRDRAEMLNILSDEIKAFKGHLIPQYSDVEIRDLPRAIIGPVVPVAFSSPSGSRTTTAPSTVTTATFRAPRKP